MPSMLPLSLVGILRRQIGGPRGREPYANFSVYGAHPLPLGDACLDYRLTPVSDGHLQKDPSGVPLANGGAPSFLRA